MGSIWTAYAITFGWAIVGSVAMAIGNIIVLKLLTYRRGRSTSGS